MSDIAAQYERVIGGFILSVLIGDKGEEWNGGQFDLLIGHFVKLRDLDLSIERARRYMMRGEIIEQGASDGGLADASLVRAD